ncbi:hypothetical protein LINPERHAP1_LOCUS4035, partial [Linum perenne]
MHVICDVVPITNEFRIVLDMTLLLCTNTMTSILLARLYENEK